MIYDSPVTTLCILIGTTRAHSARLLAILRVAARGLNSFLATEGRGEGEGRGEREEGRKGDRYLRGSFPEGSSRLNLLDAIPSDLASRA